MITINSELDKHDDIVLFSEKIAKVKEIIARTGLPPMKQVTTEAFKEIK